MISVGTLVVIAIIVVGAAGAIIFFLTSQLRTLRSDLKPDDTDTKVLLEMIKEMKGDMKGSIDKNSETLERQLREQTKMVFERLEHSSKVIRNVQEQLTSVSELGKDVKDLSNVLKSPKLRGGLGEQFLYEILGNILPKEMYKTQYKFKDGNICDAIVYVQDSIIPIDSKFPMENFKAMVESENDAQRDGYKKVFTRDVKKRIDEIASKYILPEEHTTHFAIMYVPAENVFYEAMNSQDIADYSAQKNVVLVSPNYISTYLKTLLLAYQQQELEKHAGDILKALAGIKVEAEKFDTDLSVMERHISNANKSAENVRSKFTKLFGKIEGVQALGQAEQKKLLE